MRPNHHVEFLVGLFLSHFALWQGSISCCKRPQLLGNTVSSTESATVPVVCQSNVYMNGKTQGLPAEGCPTHHTHHSLLPIVHPGANSPPGKRRAHTAPSVGVGLTHSKLRCTVCSDTLLAVALLWEWLTQCSLTGTHQCKLEAPNKTVAVLFMSQLGNGTSRSLEGSVPPHFRSTSWHYEFEALFGLNVNSTFWKVLEKPLTYYIHG